MKYKTEILYIIFGIATTFVNWLFYIILLHVFSFTVSNAIAWFLAVVFAFVVNKFYVFRSLETSFKRVFKEMTLFFSARVFSGLIEVLGLPLLVFIGLSQEILGVEAALAKGILSVFVIVANYIFSKKVIFSG
jgi:putative flippase GtrA